MRRFTPTLHVSSHARAQRLRYVREDIVRLTRLELSIRSGISVNTLQNWEQSRNTGLTEKGAKRLIEAFEAEGVYCALEWLLYGLGAPPVSPFLQYSTRPHAQDVQGSIIAQELALFHQLNAPALEALVQDDGLFPCFWPGDYVAGPCYQGQAIRTLMGMPCIIETAAGEVYVRLLEAGDQAQTYTLRCTHTHTVAHPLMEHVDVKHAAPVVWWRRRGPQR